MNAERRLLLLHIKNIAADCNTLLHTRVHTEKPMCGERARACGKGAREGEGDISARSFDLVVNTNHDTDYNTKI